MKKTLKGIHRDIITLDFDLYRTTVPIPGESNAHLSVVDLWPEAIERTIVFVHGYAGCAETWEYQINHFASEFRVVVPDLRGHGQSDAPYTRYTMDEMVLDLQAVAEHLHLPEKFILVGHSFGGAICIEYANAHPERLEKLVLIATAGEYPLPKAVNLLSKVPTAFFKPVWRYRPRWNAEVHVMKRMMLNNMVNWQGWSMMRNITTPTLIITGERDNYFPRYVFDDVGKMVANAELYDVGSAKHKVQLERHQAVNRAIERFISEGSRGSWRIKTDETSSLMQRRPWLNSYSKETPRTIPIPRQPLYKFLESAAQWHPKRAAIVFYDTEITYSQLNAQANQFAHALHRLGINSGDRIMLVLPNVPQMIIAYYGALKAGVIVVLPNPDADGAGIIKQSLLTKAKALVTLKSYRELAEAVLANTSIKSVILADIEKIVSSEIYQVHFNKGKSVSYSQKPIEYMKNIYPFETLIQKELTIEPLPNQQETAVIVFTSGTTDEPKGVCLSHRNLVANTLQTRHWIPNLQHGREVFLSTLPLMHSYGMTGAMNIPIAMAATIVLLPVFELKQLLTQIKKYRPTIFPGVPSMYTAINHAPDIRSYGLSSIKACISGAAPLPVEVQEEFEKLTRGRLVEGYGLTESAPVTHANPLYGLRKVGSIGVPIPNTDAKIVDLVTDEDLPPGKIGELVVRGPQVMQGYWEDEAQHNPEFVLKDGWLYTGDIAVMDTDGYFQIISRKRDTIMSGDYSVYPRDVEEVLYENNKVLEAAVVGVESTSSGQRIKAFVVPRPGTALSKDELLDLCRRRLEPYAVPWEIEFRETLPKSFVGKVLRRLLIEEHQSKPEE